MRILGLDVGTARIGVAVSDEDRIIASPVDYIDVKKENPVRAVEAYCLQYEVDRVVVGLPLSISGEAGGLSARRAKAFGRAVEENLGLGVIYRDERFTTTIADRVLIEGNVSRKKRKQVVDKVAAAVILQGYLDEINR